VHILCESKLDGLSIQTAYLNVL